MKKRYIFLRCFFLLMLIPTFGGCASTPTRESTGEYIDDSVITTKIKSLLLKDELLKSFHISVKTYRGVVQLSGSVDSPKTINKAGQIASSVNGVKSVKNQLVVEK
jgi:osmotically-inducible protein OsmY